MRPGELAERLGSLAVELQGEQDAEATLSAIVRAAVMIVPGARWAGVSLIEGKRVVPRVPSDPIVEKLDGLQNDTNEGPCLDALREYRTVHVDDMATDERWPRYCRTALEHGVRSLLSFQLFVTGHNLGALNLYATEAGAFEAESVTVGTIVAQHASVALSAVIADQQLQRAIDSRDVIGQAKGLLSERFNVEGLQAFRLLTQLSQDTNRKLVDVARELVEMHDAETRASLPITPE